MRRLLAGLLLLCAACGDDDTAPIDPVDAAPVDRPDARPDADFTVDAAVFDASFGRLTLTLVGEGHVDVVLGDSTITCDESCVIDPPEGVRPLATPVAAPGYVVQGIEGCPAAVSELGSDCEFPFAASLATVHFAPLERSQVRHESSPDDDRLLGVTAARGTPVYALTRSDARGTSTTTRVTALDAAGAVRWQRDLVSTSETGFGDLADSPSGPVFLTGRSAAEWTAGSLAVGAGDFLLALDPANGTPLWARNVDGIGGGQIGVTADGDAVLCCDSPEDASIAQVTRYLADDGGVVWETALGEVGSCDPIAIGTSVGAIGMYDFGDDTQSVVGFDLDTGERVWRSEVTQTSFFNWYAGLAHDPNGTFYAVGRDGSIALVRAFAETDGEPRWETQVTALSPLRAARIGDEVAVLADGIIFGPFGADWIEGSFDASYVGLDPADGAIRRARRLTTDGLQSARDFAVVPGDEHFWVGGEFQGTLAVEDTVLEADGSDVFVFRARLD